MSAALDKIIEEMKALTTDELQQLRATVDSLLSQSDEAAAEDEFERELMAEGFISKVEPLKDFSPYETYEPVRVSGKPVSEMIIEERR